MTNQGDKFWQGMAAKLRSTLGLNPMTPEEAEREYQGAEPLVIEDDVIDALCRDIIGERMARPGVLDPSPAAGGDISEVDEEVLQLNRNGTGDGAAEELIRRHRREALGGTDGNDAQE